MTKPRREANRLWAWQARSDPGLEYLGRARIADERRARAFEAAVDRRVRGEPLAYVLGHTGFRRLEIRCDSRALIPRPETEGVVELALGRVRTGRALDLGTGTGCLALALADEGAFARVVGLELERAALALAATNRAATGLSVDLVGGDLAGPLRAEAFDLVVANPPYLTAGEFERLDPSVRDWEPRSALVAGPDGLAAIAAVLCQAPDLLRPVGWLVMEVDSSRARAAAALAHAAGWSEVRIDPDLFGRERYLTACRESPTGGAG